jgi:hypothetical protein
MNSKQTGDWRRDCNAAAAPDSDPGHHDRRSFLRAAGHAGLAAVSIRGPGAGLLGSGIALLRSRRANAAGEPLVQLPEIRSRDGVLNATLTATQDRMHLGEIEFPGFLYNDSYLPPLLRLRLGDILRLRLRNNLADDPTNLHFHGLSVSPRGRSDNVFIHVRPGREFEYEVTIPAAGRQGPGLFWCHPHGHGFVNRQMLGGMSGGLVIEGSEMLFPILKDLPERFFLIKHAEPGGGREVISINGQMNPVVEIGPGEMQFWRIANIGASLFIPFQFEGMSLYVVATDGHRCRGRARRAISSSAPVSGSMQSRSVRRPASTPWPRSCSRTWRGGSRFRRSRLRRSCPRDRRDRRTPKPRFCLRATTARDGSTRCGRAPSPAAGAWNIREQRTAAFS